MGQFADGNHVYPGLSILLNITQIYSARSFQENLLLHFILVIIFFYWKLNHLWSVDNLPTVLNAFHLIVPILIL